MTISAVILTKNSSKTIEKCLNSLDWSDEVVIIDDNSTDDTLDIAKKHHTTIFVHSLDNNFSQQRNFGLGKANSEWILFVDSDEVISSLLREEIELSIKHGESKVEGYFIKREDTMWGKKLKHGESGDIWLLRLAKKGAGEWQGKVHEVWNVQGETRKLRNALDHFPHPTINGFLAKINYYSTLRAEELFERKIHTGFFDIILYMKGKFFIDFLVKRGFLDGTPGFLVAVLMSFHSFLVRGKLWQLQNAQQ